MTASRVAEWLEERLGWRAAAELLDHKVVPRHRHSVWYYFGGMTLFLFAVQVSTGILLLLYYRPSAETAFESVQFIMTDVQFGWLIRSVHSWSANLMVLFVFIHMFSVVFLHAYRKPRELTTAEAIALDRPAAAGATVYEPGGCLYCANRGFVGRLGVFELLPVDESLARAIAEGAEEAAIVGLARQNEVKRLTDRASRAFAELGIAARGGEGERIGVWTGSRKIASLGIHLARWRTTHGFALNVGNDLTPFSLIVPCGIRGAGVTSMERELGGRAPPDDEIERAAGDPFDDRVVLDLLAVHVPDHSVFAAVDPALLLRARRGVRRARHVRAEAGRDRRRRAVAVQ